MKVIQADTIDSFAQIVLPHLINIYEKYGSEVLSDSLEFDKGIRMIKLIMNWDCNFNVDSYQASIFMSWEYLFL